MDEYFLQFLWKFQKFGSQPLQLTSGESLTVFQPGFQNQNSGPDFLEAKIKIGELVWSGSVEVHFKSSEWQAHNHHLDKAYENVVLHVVWTQDKSIELNNKPIPTLELAAYVPENLEAEYRKYINQPEVILCGNKLRNMPRIQTSAMIDRAFAARLQEKGKRVLEILKAYDDNWEEAAYFILSKNFGFKTNSDSFEKLARSLPFKILKKHTDHPHQVEALIFGMAGFLEGKPKDSHQQALLTEFIFLQKKYQLTPLLSRHHWKFSRLRPANFPTVRLAQFIAWIQSAEGIFQTLLKIDNIRDALASLKHPLPHYWETHYDFAKKSGKKYQMGQSSLENIIINSIAPILTAYSKYIDDVSYLEKVETVLSQLKPEANYITRAWSSVDIIPQNACDSQGLIYQYHTFCKQKRCLQCNIGISILNQ